MLLQEIEASVRRGNLEEARENLGAWDTHQVCDVDLHLRLADLCEELGLTSRALDELNLAFRDEPERLDTLKRIAQIHLDGGHLEKALRCYRAVATRDPTDVENWQALGQLLQELGRTEEARQCIRDGIEATGSAFLGGHLRALVRAEPEPEVIEDISPALASRFVQLFSGREGVYARQWASGPKTGYSPIREPFTPKVARNHLLGNHTVGVYLLRMDSTVHFCALDLDVPRSVTPGEHWDATFRLLREHALALHGAALQFGLANYLEDSGGKGIHLWCFFERPIAASLARHVAKHWSALLPTPEGIQLEVFPKQTRVAPDQYGNLIKLPLGIHRGSGRRAVFLDACGEPVSNQEEFLFSIQRNRKDVALDFVSSTPAPGELMEESKSPPSPLEPPYEPAEDLALQTVLSRCVTLRTVKERACASGVLSHDEVIVLSHSLGHLERGPEAVNSILRVCGDIAESRMLQSRLRGNPISCARIRARIPHVTSQLDCDCSLEYPGQYPHPLLHLNQPLESADLEEAHRHALVRDYRTAQEQLQVAQNQLEHLRRITCEWMKAHGVTELESSAGHLRLDPDTGELSLCP